MMPMPRGESEGFMCRYCMISTNFFVNKIQIIWQKHNIKSKLVNPERPRDVFPQNL